MKYIELPGLTEEQQQGLSLDIAYADLDNAVSQMELGKTPGLDGLPIEFYKTFKDELIPYLVELLQYCHIEGVLPASWQEARLVLSPKEGKDHKVSSAY